MFDLLNSPLWVCIAIIYLDEIIWVLSLVGHVYNAKKNTGNGYKSPWPPFLNLPVKMY